MFKCLLLQSWHSLSDPGLEETLRVRLDFLQFTGFMVGDKFPDETTFCRFRNKLVSSDKFLQLLSEINRQLEHHGLKVKAAGEAIVDATLIPSHTRPRKMTDLDEDGNSNTRYSSDPDARWKKKGLHSYFGCQAFA